jgi:hypothetical protein
VLYGTKFGTDRGNSKIILRYKAKPFDADSTYQEVEVPTGNFITWTDGHVAFKIPQVSFGSNSFVIAKIKMIKAGYEDQPALFPPQNVVFFTIAQSLPRNIGDLNCDNVVNEADFAILLNNYNL